MHAKIAGVANIPNPILSLYPEEANVAGRSAQDCAATFNIQFQHP